MLTAKAQISLRIRAVWSGSSLSVNRIIGYYNGWYFAHAQDELNLRIFCACSKVFFCLTRSMYYYQSWQSGRYMYQGATNKHINKTILYCSVNVRLIPYLSRAKVKQGKNRHSVFSGISAPFVCLFVLRLYGPVTQLESCRGQFT